MEALFLYDNDRMLKACVQELESDIFIEDLYELLGCAELDPSDVDKTRHCMEARMTVSASGISVRAIEGNDLNIWLSSPQLTMQINVEFDSAGRSLVCKFAPKATRRRSDGAKKIAHGWKVIEAKATALEVAALYQKLADTDNLQKML